MSERDPNRPIEIIPMADLDIPSDDEILSIVRFIRGNALKTSTATPPRLSTDIQPWTLTHITRWSSGDTDVWLMDPNAGRGQSVKLRRNGDSWTILELR
jgi:hypothetical protein